MNVLTKYKNPYRYISIVANSGQKIMLGNSIETAGTSFSIDSRPKKFHCSNKTTGCQDLPGSDGGGQVKTDRITLNSQLTDVCQSDSRFRSWMDIANRCLKEPEFQLKITPKAE